MYYSHVRETDGQKEPVIDHLREVAEMSADFARPFGAEGWAWVMGFAHDIGKYSAGFQRRLLENGSRVDHSTAGAFVLDRSNLPLLSYCVAGHHRGLPDGGTKGDPEDAATLCSRLRKASEGGLPPFDEYRNDVVLEEPQKPALLCKDIPPKEQCYALSFLTRMLFSCLVDADFLCTERFMNNEERVRSSIDGLDALRDALEEKIASFYPSQSDINALRCSVLDACLQVSRGPKGVYSLTVPTGGGKTYASLRFALNHASCIGNDMQRVIYCIPYTSIIDQNAAVFRDVLGGRNVLEHHANFDFDDETEEGRALRLATENWDAPVIVTTNVQFFESLYGSRTSRCRKLHSIAGSVIVLDEAQMLPTKQLVPCVKALAELVNHYGCTVVLCTATQPSLNDFFLECGCEVHEIVPDAVELAEKLRRVTYRYLEKLGDEELADRLCEEPQVLCIVNSRKQARAVYERISGEGSFHLSTLMHPAHRGRVLQEIRRRLSAGEPCRVISTSLIEAGVDVDFPVVYRSLAGIDSMIQAAGRANRNARKSAEESFVYLFEPAESYAVPPDIHQKAAVSRGIMRDLAKRAACDTGTEEEKEGGRCEGVACDIGSLDVMTRYFDDLYGLRKENLDASEVYACLSKYPNPRSIPFETAAQRFQMIEDGSLPVVVPDDAVADDIDAVRYGKPSRGTFRRLGRYSVGVYKQDLESLMRAGAVESIGKDMYILVDQSRYSEEAGLSCAVEGGAGLFY